MGGGAARGQLTGLTSLSAAQLVLSRVLTVMVNWRKGGSLDPEAVAQAAGYSIHQCDDGSWDPIYQVAEHWEIHPFLYTPVDVAAWADVLREHGPLWIVVTGSPTHTVIIHGLEGFPVRSDRARERHPDHVLLSARRASTMFDSRRLRP